ncbi:Acyl-CoA N-acyltransferase [Penicillium malachiteum]|uniref:Acyl-CoA N-acyltransferase n=1 Tax=Penicillium malachiteum TaxID=1324776 RepID=UPI002549225D|nr:Acyl-CoA N-acyltransferase [Penicillium malachiteum]KAJ5730657.1 Acyl-CoA N-acyltransferase [Penicillium malachiteum]
MSEINTTASSWSRSSHTRMHLSMLVESTLLGTYERREIGVDSAFGSCAKDDFHFARFLQKIGFESVEKRN